MKPQYSAITFQFYYKVEILKIHYTDNYFVTKFKYYRTLFRRNLYSDLRSTNWSMAHSARKIFSPVGIFSANKCSFIVSRRSPIIKKNPVEISYSTYPQAQFSMLVLFLFVAFLFSFAWFG